MALVRPCKKFTCKKFVGVGGSADRVLSVKKQLIRYVEIVPDEETPNLQKRALLPPPPKECFVNGRSFVRL